MLKFWSCRESWMNEKHVSFSSCTACVYPYPWLADCRDFKLGIMSRLCRVAFLVAALIRRRMKKPGCQLSAPNNLEVQPQQLSKSTARHSITRKVTRSMSKGTWWHIHASYMKVTWHVSPFWKPSSFFRNVIPCLLHILCMKSCERGRQGSEN